MKETSAPVISGDQCRECRRFHSQASGGNRSVGGDAGRANGTVKVRESREHWGQSEWTRIGGNAPRVNSAGRAVVAGGSRHLINGPLTPESLLTHRPLTQSGKGAVRAACDF